MGRRPVESQQRDDRDARFMTASQVHYGLLGGGVNKRSLGAAALECAAHALRARGVGRLGAPGRGRRSGVAAGGAASSPDGFLLGLPALPAGPDRRPGTGGMALVAGRRAGLWLLGAAAVLLLVIAGARLPGVAALAGATHRRPRSSRAALPRRRRRSTAMGLVPRSCPRDRARLRPGRGARASAGRTGGRRAALPDGRGQPDPRPRPLPRAGLRRGTLSRLPSGDRSRRTIACADANGEIYSLHALGLSLLVLPAYAVASYAGASFFMALLAVWLALEIRGVLRETIRREGADGRRPGSWPSARRSCIYAGLDLHGDPGRSGRGARPALRSARPTLSSRRRSCVGVRPRLPAVAQRAVRDPGRACSRSRARAAVPAGDGAGPLRPR